MNLKVAAKGAEVIDLPPPYAKTLPLSKAGKFLLPVKAYTDLLGGSVYAREYRIEDVLVDPDAELEDGCLIVAQFAGGAPHLMGYDGFTGRDHNGRFVPAGDPNECFALSCGLRIARNEPLRIIRILGRYVGERRRYPVMG